MTIDHDQANKEIRSVRVENQAIANPIQAYGIWAPGIVLMRGVNFKTKALVISLVFLLPVCGLLF